MRNSQKGRKVDAVRTLRSARPRPSLVETTDGSQPAKQRVLPVPRHAAPPALPLLAGPRPIPEAVDIVSDLLDLDGDDHFSDEDSNPSLYWTKTGQNLIHSTI